MEPKSDFSGPRTHYELTSWDGVLEHCTTGFPTPSFHPGQAAAVEDNPRLKTSTGELYTDHLGVKQVEVTTPQDVSLWEVLGYFHLIRSNFLFAVTWLQNK